MRARRGRFTAWIVTFCVLLIFTASLVEVTHLCESAGGQTRRDVASRSSRQTGSGICEICATSHHASTPMLTSVAVSFAALVNVPLVAVQPLSRLQAFTMDVRPPPFLSL
jgi:hypothetical protein